MILCLFKLLSAADCVARFCIKDGYRKRAFQMLCEKHCKGCLLWYLCCFYFYFADPYFSMEVFKALSFDPHTMLSSLPVGGPSPPQEALVCLHRLSSMVSQLLQAFSRYLSPLMCSRCQRITRHCSFRTGFSSVSVLVLLAFSYREWLAWTFLQETGFMWWTTTWPCSSPQLIVLLLGPANSLHYVTHCSQCCFQLQKAAVFSR